VIGLVASFAPIGGCTDLLLAKYRDDKLATSYRYVLGEEYIVAKGVTLCYQEYGTGDPLIILTGLGTDVDFWETTVPVLAKEHRVYALDLPGFGKSDKPEARYDLDWMEAIIIAFMDAKHIQRANILGESMGGQIALLLALDHRDRVEKIILMGSVGDWPPPGFLLAGFLNYAWPDIIVGDHIRRCWPDIFQNISLTQNESTERIFKRQMAVRANGTLFADEGRASTRALRGIVFATCRYRLPNVKVPVLLLWGDEDVIHPKDAAIYMHEHLPDSKLVIIPNAGHEVFIDQPEIFDREVLQFLREGTGNGKRAAAGERS